MRLHMRLSRSPVSDLGFWGRTDAAVSADVRAFVFAAGEIAVTPLASMFIVALIINPAWTV